MKKVILLSAILFLSSCEFLFPPLTIKVIGSGTFTVAYADQQISKVWETGQTSFDVEMLTDEAWSFSAQSNNGTGVTVEAYIGTEKIRSNSASGYGVASISGTY